MNMHLVLRRLGLFNKQLSGEDQHEQTDVTALHFMPNAQAAYSLSMQAWAMSCMLADSILQRLGMRRKQVRVLQLAVRAARMRRTRRRRSQVSHCCCFL